MRGKTLLWRGPGAWLVVLVFAIGCAGDGCACMTDVPGGFPADERQSGAVQARLTATGLDYVHDNMSQLTGLLLDGDGPLTFPIPPTCSGEQKVCCYVPYGSCQLVFDIEERQGDSPRVELEPIGGNRVEVTIRARVRTESWLPVHARGPLGGEVSCWVYIDSRRSGTPWITIRSIMELFDDPVTGTTRGEIVSTSLSGVTSGDVSIDGGFLCGFGDPADGANSMNAQIRQRLPGELADLLCARCTGDNDCAPHGTCGAGGTCQLDDGACMVSLGTQGRIAAADAFGDLVNDHADAIDLYLAVGGGVSTDGDGVHLNVLSGIKAARGVAPHACVPAVPEPSLPAVADSGVLASNVHPRTGEGYDLGLGIHKSFLERAAWAAHQAGFLCLDVGASRVPLLQADALSILAPSLIDLTRGEPAPMFLLVRPQNAPTMALGAGTFTQVPGGEKKLDEALITLGMKDLEVDFYAWIDERYVRILTLRADLTVPVGLDIDGEGRIVPVLGDLAEAFDEIRVINSGILAESPDEIARVFPAVLSIALPALSDSLTAFDVPAFAGMSLELGPDSLTAIDDDSMLGIFGDLAPAATALRRGATARASLVRVHADRPAVTLALDGDAIDGAAALEWSVRIDGGFWSPYSSARELTLERRLFDLIGRHTVEVRARHVGDPRTTGAPAMVEVDIRARPALTRPAEPIGFHGTAEASGCDCRTGGDGAGGGLLLLVGAVVIGLRRRGSPLVVLAAALALAACASDAGGGDGDGEPDPTVVNPGPTGRWASMAADGDRAVLAAYEQEFGDLVLADVDGEGRPAFRVIDGAPAEPVVLDPAGYRGGVTAVGANVGGYTSVALAGGEVVIAYQDLDRHALRLVREAGGAWVGEDVDVPVDDTEHVGRYSSLVFDGAGLPAIAYMAARHVAGEADDDPGAVHAELRVARASATGAWSIAVVDTAEAPINPDVEDVALGTGAFASAGVLPDGRLVVAFHRQVTGDVLLAVEDVDAETGWRIEDLDAAPNRVRGQWCTLAVDGAGAVHVVYQDAIDDRLLYRWWSEADGAGPIEVVDDGRRDGERPHSVGGSARLLLLGDMPVVLYQDGTLADLLWARRDPEGNWSREALLGGEVGYGFHVAGASLGTMAWVSTYSYDPSSWPPGHTEVRALRP